MSTISGSGHGDSIAWKCHTKLEKFNAPSTAVLSGKVAPDEVVEVDGNLLMYGGADLLWLGLKGALTTTTGQQGTVFSGTAKGTAIGVGDSNTAAAATQTNLQAATNKLRKKMDAGFPTHTTGTAGSTQSKMVFKTTFSTGQANFAWQEWGIFNTTGAGGRMLNRKVESLGTKTTAATWALTITLSLA